MTSHQRLHTSDRHGIRSRLRASYRPRLESLEDRTLLSPCVVDRKVDDTNPGSLRYCMNLIPKPDLIAFDPLMKGFISLSSPLPVIDWHVTIDGPGQGSPALWIWRGSGGDYRIFDIASDTTVAIKDLWISGGRAAVGAGIRNAGDLTISNSRVVGNRAIPIDGELEILGGGISNSGRLTITDGTWVSGNDVRGSDMCSQTEPPEGPGTITQCPFRLAGAGIHNAPEAHLEINGGSSTASNIVGCDIYDPCLTSRYPSDAVEFYGGGIYNQNGTVIVTNSTIRGNEVHASAPGSGQSFRGHGGAIQSDCYGSAIQCLVIDSSTISENAVYLNGTIEGAGVIAAAHGAAISMAGPEPPQQQREVKIVNSTIAGNWLFNKVTGDGCPASPAVGGCKTSGGAIWYKVLHVDIRWTTITGNGAWSNGVVEGGGIHASNSPPAAKLTVRSTIFANNTANGAKSNVVLNGFDMISEGYNLFDDIPGEGEIATDQVVTQTCFKAIPNEYGDGYVYPLLLRACQPGSRPAALNRGGDADPGLEFDQRGFSRTVDGSTDSGAVECQPGECGLSDGGTGISLPDNDFGTDSFGVSNKPAARDDEEAALNVPAETPSISAKPAFVVAGPVVGRHSLIITADVSLWTDPILTLGAFAEADLRW